MTKFYLLKILAKSKIFFLRVLINPHNLKFTGKIQVYERTYDVFKKIFMYVLLVP